MSVAVSHHPHHFFGLAAHLGIRLLQWAALAIVLTVAFALGGILAGMATPQAAAPSAPAAAPDAAVARPAENPAAAVVPLLIVSAIVAAVLEYLVLQSAGHGWKLIGALFLAFYGSNTIVSQLESLVYLPAKLPGGTIPRLFVMGAIIAAIFSPLAVVILGKVKASPDAARLYARSTASSWAWKLVVIVIGYLVLYYGFGYYVAWKQPAVREFYGGNDPGTFFAQMKGIWKATPWMFAFQAMRAVLWTLLVLPFIRMLQWPAAKVGVLTALLFAVWSVQLILPNPFMPEAVRNAHLIETLGSNFLFGSLVGSLCARRTVA